MNKRMKVGFAFIFILNIAVVIAVIGVVVSRQTEKQSQGQLTKEQIDNIYMGHVTTIAMPSLTRTNETLTDTPLRNWVPFVGPERQLLYNGMKCENGSIIVPATGVYVVYSHMKFSTEMNSYDDAESDFHHSITRYSALKQNGEAVLRNVISENKNSIIDGASLEYSSDVHGLVQLDAGDQLMVTASGMNPLRHDRDWHYFGVYMT
ncbi:tumor necrosis factor-like isoform X2 [Haliotis rufescens]|uniref:tumor necrosis factor-like isoform X2 n=1 Tax=Haliotis rufescens TaxID=6454 RepID=UPI00201F781F|nr:tumor necrosis factor-like isoform X2 [Haliotis rufescens]